MALAVALNANVVGGVEFEHPAGRRVEHPRGAAAVLHAQGPVGHHAVEQLAGELARHRFVITDCAYPALRVAGNRGGRERPPHGLGVGRVTGSAGHRVSCGGQREQVQVMVVQAGNDSAAARVDHEFVAVGLQAAVHFDQ